MNAPLPNFIPVVIFLGLLSLLHRRKRNFTKEEQNHCKNWTYNGTDGSALSPHLYRIWDILFQLIPATWSPLYITAMGFCSILLLVFLVSPFGISKIDDVYPWWLFVVAATLIFLYQAFDALDGMQGRTTLMYNGPYCHPVPSLADHWVDSMVTNLGALSMIMLLSPKEDLLPCFTLTLAASWMLFYAATYESIVTGKMRFQEGFANPTEGMAFTILSLLLTGIFPAIWHIQVPILQTSLAVIMVSIMLVGAILSLSSSIQETANHLMANPHQSRKIALLQLLPLVIPLLSLIYCVHMHPQDVLMSPWTFGLFLCCIYNTGILYLLHVDFVGHPHCLTETVSFQTSAFLALLMIQDFAGLFVCLLGCLSYFAKLSWDLFEEMRVCCEMKSLFDVQKRLIDQTTTTNNDAKED